MIKTTAHLGFALLLVVGLLTSEAHATEKKPTKNEQQEKCDIENRECLAWCDKTRSASPGASADPDFLLSCNLGCSQPWLYCTKNIQVRAPPAANKSEITSQSMHPIKQNRRLIKPTSAALPHKPNSDASSAHWAIQLASVRNPNEVKTEWRRLRGRFKVHLHDKKLTVVRVHLGERGLFYRLRVDGFQHKSGAMTTCASIKAKGGN